MEFGSRLTLRSTFPGTKSLRLATSSARKVMRIAKMHAQDTGACFPPHQDRKQRAWAIPTGLTARM